MNKHGPIIVVEDDIDDRQLFSTIFSELSYENEIVFFSTGEDALEYFSTTSTIPFIIISDINLPLMGGFDLRDKLHTFPRLTIKCIPCIFFTTATNKEAVVKAYAQSAQGFFIKPDSYERLFQTIRAIIDYWRYCYSPVNLFEKATVLY